MIEDHNLTLNFNRAGLDFFKGSDDSEGGEGVDYGVTIVSLGRIWLLVDLKLIIPLFRDDLDDFDKRHVEYIVANTLLHEITVSLKSLVLESS